MTERPLVPAAFSVPHAEGDARWWLGSLAVIKVTAEETGGAYSLLDITEPPDAAAPLHIHHREDEGFWVLDGDITFVVGEQTIPARVGDFVFGPRGIPHRYTAGPSGCRLLFIVTPGGFEQLVIEMSRPATSRTIPPPSDDEPDWARVAAIADAHGIELVSD